MQITIKGEMSLADIRQAIFEELHNLEEVFAVSHSLGATVYVNPSNGTGDAVTIHKKDGRVMDKLLSSGPYRSAAEDFKI